MAVLFLLYRALSYYLPLKDFCLCVGLGAGGGWSCSLPEEIQGLSEPLHLCNSSSTSYLQRPYKQ